MPEPSRSAQPRSWLLLAVLVVGCSAALSLAGLPSPVLFGALIAGLVMALGARQVPEVPEMAFTGAQAVLGVSIGVLFDPDTLAGLRHDWFPVLAVSLATLVVSVAAGFVLRLHRSVSAATGAFAMVAGGASGIVAIARELGADDRVVAVVQYLRVLLIIVGMPLVARFVFGSASGSVPGPASGDDAGLLVNLLVTAVSVAGGLLLDRWLAIPAGSLLLPLSVAVLISLTGVAGALAVPDALQNVGYALIGLQVGLRFTRASLRAVAGLLPLAVATILGMIAVSAVLGALLARATGRTALDGYLATTPGGLYAVLATAVGSGSDVTFILTVQIVRLFVMLFSAPLLARWLRRTG